MCSVDSVFCIAKFVCVFCLIMSAVATMIYNYWRALCGDDEVDAAAAATN